MRSDGQVCFGCAGMSYRPKELCLELFQQSHIPELARLPVALPILSHY